MYKRQVYIISSFIITVQPLLVIKLRLEVELLLGGGTGGLETVCKPIEVLNTDVWTEKTLKRTGAMLVWYLSNLLASSHRQYGVARALEASRRSPAYLRCRPLLGTAARRGTAAQ